jgi:kinesin family protein 15
MNQFNDNKENIKVVLRIRPRNEKELEQWNNIKVDANSIMLSTKNEVKQFTYDYIAKEESSQSEIFEQCAKQIADYTLQGYNGTIFVYGQTGAGKTYTLLGPKFSGSNSFLSEEELNGSFGRYYMKKEEESRGVLPRVIDYLFERSRNIEGSTLTFSCSFLEIYQEQISDLLDPSQTKPVNIRDLSDSVMVEGLSKVSIASADEALGIIIKGNFKLTLGSKLRHVGSTNMNNESSRSHAVFSIYIENKSKENGKMRTKKSVFHLIDLAGSERQKFTETQGNRLKEAGMINKSLMQLGHVIKSLLEIAEGKARHIHYRDSKLTHLLKDSLGGNSKVILI